MQSKLTAMKLITNSLFLLFCVVAMAQQPKFHLVINDEPLSQDACLTNNTNYNELSISPAVDTTMAFFALEINVMVGENSLKFSSISEFESFDFKFWLLSNNAYDSDLEFTVQLDWVNEKNQSFSQTIKRCLSRQATEGNDRGGRGKADFVKLPIHFATDRNIVETDDLNELFGTERSDLKYGITEVSIPHDHKIGEIESPSVWKFEFSEDPAKHIMMHEIKVMDKEQFFNSLSYGIQKSEKKSTFLFIHGYNTSFSDAAKRTAQISYDLLFEGKAVFYSWPSQASTVKYAKDEANIEWSRHNIKLFLNDYLSRSGAEEIFLVAHSMGNRGLTRAIIEVVAEKPELRDKIKEIILAAPDIDADVFKRDIAPQMVSKVQKPITLYVSSDDLALKASKELHGNPRAGDSGQGMVIVDGVETIDASGIDTSFLSHSYFADTSSIISDIFDLIQSGKRALNRESLKLMKLSNQIYWKVKQ